ncbi:hypothetical protein T484DRAFT_1932831 [Baffinella frigidus]|nr:hypothetical protein T484DRAFT_1932831 [Cryptophyta sp. CCMP2293]
MATAHGRLRCANHSLQPSLAAPHKRTCGEMREHAALANASRGAESTANAMERGVQSPESVTQIDAVESAGRGVPGREIGDDLAAQSGASAMQRAVETESVKEIDAVERGASAVTEKDDRAPGIGTVIGIGTGTGGSGVLLAALLAANPSRIRSREDATISTLAQATMNPKRLHRRWVMAAGAEEPGMETRGGAMEMRWKRRSQRKTTFDGT